MKKTLAALGKAACYTALFLGAQFFIVMAATMIEGFALGFEIALSGGMPDMQALQARLTEAILSGATVYTLIANAVTLGLLWVFFAARKKNVLAEVSFREVPALAYVPLSIGGAALAVTITTVLGMLPIPDAVWEEYANASAHLEQTGFFAVLSTVLVAPVAEEVVFRGLVYTRLRRAMPVWAAALLQSLIFASLHGQALWIGYAFVMGLALTVVFERTGSVLASIATHVAFNLVGGYFLSELPVTPLFAALCAAAAAGCWIWLARICPYTKLRPEK